MDSNQAHLNSLKRVALFNLDAKNDIIHFRHFYIKKNPANINKNVFEYIFSFNIYNI